MTISRVEAAGIEPAQRPLELGLLKHWRSARAATRRRERLADHAAAIVDLDEAELATRKAASVCVAPKGMAPSA